MVEPQKREGEIRAADAARLLLDLHKENTTFVRHYEDIRFKFSQITVTLAAALVGFARISQTPDMGTASSPTIALCIIFLGMSGVLITLKYTERADRHAVISRAYRRACSDIVVNCIRAQFSTTTAVVAWPESCTEFALDTSGS